MARNNKKQEQVAQEQVAQEQVAQEQVAQETALSTITEEQKVAIANSRFASLKSLELAAKGLELDSIAADVAERSIVQARIFAEIADGKLYEKDGFKNMDECATALFGQGKSSASQKATAYRRFFADDASDTCKEVAKAVGPFVSTLYELSKMTDDELKSHLDAGDFNGGITQDSARAMAKGAKEARDNGKPKVVKTFDLSGFRTSFPMDITTSDGNTIHVDGLISPVKLEDDIPLNDDDILDVCGFSKEGKVLKAKFEEVTYYIALESTASAIYVLTATEHKKEKPADIPAVKVNLIRKMAEKGYASDDIADLVEMPVDVVEKYMK